MADGLVAVDADSGLIVRRTVCSTLMTLMAALVVSVPAHAQTWPVRPIRIIVGYTPGGASDVVGRSVAAELQKINGQPVVVENRPGLGGMLGMSLVAKSPPDGYTLAIAVSGTMVTGPHLQKNTPYDPLTDFEPVSMVAKAPMVMLATPGSPIDSVGALIREAKARPGEVMFGSGAQAFELALRLFTSKAGVRMGSVPYPGGAPASIDVMSGRVPVMVDTIGAQAANIRAGKLKALAVLDSRRSVVLPDVPTVAEAGVPGYEAVGWVGIVAPKGTPEAVVTLLNTQLRQVMALPELKERLTLLGFEPATGSAKEFQLTIQTEHAKWGAVVREAGLAAP